MSDETDRQGEAAAQPPRRAGLRVDAVFGALSDATRREVLARLSQQPATATELAAQMPVSRQAIAKHLSALRRADLVETSRQGREARYQLTPEPLGEAMAWMTGVGAEWDRRLDRLHDLLDDPAG